MSNCVLSILFAVCEDNEIEYFEQCYHEDDIEFLQGLIIVFPRP